MPLRFEGNQVVSCRSYCLSVRHTYHRDRINHADIATMTVTQHRHRHAPDMRILRKPLPAAAAGNPSSRRSSRSRRPFPDRAGARRAGRPARGPEGPRGTVRRLRGAARGFLREKRASAAIEAAIALTVLVLGFGALMEIVRASYAEDRMGRAARAAARALALDPAADACAAIRGELRLAGDFACSTQSGSTQSSGVSVRVDRGVNPTTLPATLDADATAGTGDMVLIRIGWSREPWTFGGLLRAANAADTSADAGQDATRTVSMTAVGLARCEAALCGQGTS